MSEPGASLAWELGDGVRVRPLRASDAPLFHSVIVRERAHLDRWLRWSSGIATLADAEAMIASFEKKEAEGDGFFSGVWAEEALVGGVVVWYVHPTHRNAEVGYWLASSHLGRGLASRAAERATSHLFAAGVHRVEMQCAVENAASRAIPERLGFRLEGVRRESHWITNRFLDHCVYGKLASDPPGRNA
jgi:ribosomal-protein-serine acetyltransferase